VSGIHDMISTVTAETTHGHGVRLPEGMTEERALSIYDSYNLNHCYDASLPITRYRQDVSLSLSV